MLRMIYYIGMNTFSKAGIGLILGLVLALFKMFGIEVDDSQLQVAVEGLLTFISFALLIWGQLDRKDLKWGILRKSAL